MRAVRPSAYSSAFPTSAPGTGTPVSGGLSSHQAQEILRHLDGINLVGMEVIEVWPPYDHAEITSLAGATIALELICLYASRGRKARSMDDLTWRKAVPGDAAECIALRARTRENAFTEAQLRALGITVESWDDGIRSGLFSGHVCCARGRMVGYCFGDTGSGEIAVLVMLPEYERVWIGGGCCCA